MVDKGPLPLDYASLSADSTKFWGLMTFLVGVCGAPISILLVAAFGSFVPMILCSAAALAFIYQAQIRLKRPGLPRNTVGSIGIVLTFVWAPAFLVWSLFFWVSPV